MISSGKGIGLGFDVSLVNQYRKQGSASYLDPSVKEALVGIWIADQNNNDSSTRNIIKNKIPNAGGDFELLNFAYKLNSGYGKYEVDFTVFTYRVNVVSINDNKIVLKSASSCAVPYANLTDAYQSWKGKVTFDSNDSTHNLSYDYRDIDGKEKHFVITKSGEYSFPTSYKTETGEGTYSGFFNRGKSGVIIEQIPSFQGAVVTDGVDDLIVSQKSVQDMLGGSNELSVVTMMCNLTNDKYTYNNQIRPYREGFVRTRFINNSGGKLSISGYTIKNIDYNASIPSSNTTDIKDILGDKNDFGREITNGKLDGVFSVEGYLLNDGTIYELSQVAWYWTFIAKRALTTDEINQVIAYYNLDKYVKPDVYYDVKKQGLSNDTPDADWYLKDFSGNGRDMQLYNYGKTPESGINEEGGLQSDGVTDYGQYVGDLGLKDYTVAVDRAYPSLKGNGVPIVSNISEDTATPFLFEFADNTSVVRPYSFGATTVLSPMELSRKISYQSTYIYDGTAINKGLHGNTGNGLTIGRFGIDTQYANIALWSLLLFPYSLSEFLLERQLKRYKLGTLYPDMVEWRPIIKSNGSYEYIKFYISGALAVNGQYYTPQVMSVQIKPNGIDVPNVSVNGKPLALGDINNGVYRFVYSLDKSPQKVDITIDEYIRYEDIVQPYPTIFKLIDAETNYEYTYGDKLKVGSKVKFTNYTNLLPELYNPNGNGKYNGDIFYTGTIITVEKNMVFSWSSPFTYLKANEPNCILAPQILRIPNSSYKILGYIPDLTGKGNHGVFNNFAFTEESGVDSNGIVHFDGVDDFITIPTLSHGAKQVLMKVNWQEINRISYDQRNGNTNAFAIYISDEGNFAAYNARNNGQTYIDGVLNSAIKASQLKDITHNITITNNNVTNTNTISPIIGCSYIKVLYSKMALFAFMSFDEISSEDEIKELNDIVGIEGSYVES